MSSWVFFDPLFRGPLWGAFFMGVTLSLMGVILFLRKRCLLAEVLSHAAYPGAVLGALLSASFFGVFIGAFFSAMLGMKAVDFVREKKKHSLDVSLVFVLATFFGVGTLLVSVVQAVLPSRLQSVYAYFWGQAATMGDSHVFAYALMAFLILLFLGKNFPALQAHLFDPFFAKQIRLPIVWLDRGIFVLLLVALILGIRSVGVVLISAMLVAPAIFARQCSSRLKPLFFLAALSGGLSGLIGTYLSIVLPFSIPMGPTIVLVVSSLAFISLFFAPEKGRLPRALRALRFRYRCMEENVVKALWKEPDRSFESLKGYLNIGSPLLFWILRSLEKEGLIERNPGYFLTEVGGKRGAYLVRLHRLWEVYLASSLKARADLVHASAEEIEHILTPELEKQLTDLLEHPTEDPHQQQIPPKEIV